MLGLKGITKFTSLFLDLKRNHGMMDEVELVKMIIIIHGG